MTTKVGGYDVDWPVLVGQARDGDEGAWRQIVDQLSGVVWKVLMSYELASMDREDAFASTFFRLFDKLDTVQDPKKLPGWIATVARNEANAIWRNRKRLVPSDQLPLREANCAAIDEGLLDRELLVAVAHAFDTLPAQGQALLRLLTAVPALSYDEISALLGMPRGSIGPTAGRLLNQLRRAIRADDEQGGRG